MLERLINFASNDGIKVDRRGFLKLAAAAPFVKPDKITPFYDWKHETLGHELLVMESGLGVQNSDFKLLDEFIDEVNKRKEFSVGSKTNYEEHEATWVLNHVKDTINDFGFSYAYNGLFNQGLKSGLVDCYDLSILYKSVADALSLPLFMVRAPGHVFLRHQKGRESFNWEATVLNPKQGSDLPDEYYIQTYNISDDSRRLGVYLKNMTSSEMRSLAYQVISAHNLINDELDDGLANANHALYLDPKNNAMLNVRGELRADFLGDEEGALNDFSMAIRLDPNDSRSYFHRGIIFEERRQLEEAYEDYSYAINKFSRHKTILFSSDELGHAHMRRGDVLFEMERYAEATNDYLMAAELTGKRDLIRNKLSKIY
ncbi:hypothetical protein GOV05_03045 [Candidatus Woesearchaeota archaeon]|nr:hypothetical protein [Candidatus Woesearchaeota archaeon]